LEIKLFGLLNLEKAVAKRKMLLIPKDGRVVAFKDLKICKNLIENLMSFLIFF
jgi:hypothetical protein